jgi:rRNA-processing protein FCF1
MIYALDSDTISYMLKENKDVQAKFSKTISGDNDYSIPPIVYYEIKRGSSLNSKFRVSAAWVSFYEKID